MFVWFVCVFIVSVCVHTLMLVCGLCVCARTCVCLQVLMGSVPDRGGRPGEIEPPMPDWKRERAHGGDSSHRRNKYPKHPKKKNRK